MSARIPDGTLTVQSEELQLAAARTTRKVQEAIARECALIARVEALEREIAQIRTRVEAIEAVADVVLVETPIPFMPAPFVEAA